MAVTARLADANQCMIGVPDLANRRAALVADEPHLARRHDQRRNPVLTGGELDLRTGRAGQLAALAGEHLDVVNHQTERDVAQHLGVADARLRCRPGHDFLTDLDPLRRQDVALLAVSVMQEGDAGRTVRVVLDGRDLRRDAILVALPVDDAIATLVATTATTGCDVAVRVAARRADHWTQQRLLGRRTRDLGKVRDRRDPAAG